MDLGPAHPYPLPGPLRQGARPPCLPEGVVYGGLSPEDAIPLRKAHLEGGEVYREKLLEVI